MVVIEITFPEEFDEVLRKNTKVAVTFTASWYGPCRYIRPVFKPLSENYKSVVFVSLDVDSLAALARKHDIRAMPTFMFFSSGELVGELTGADKAGLEAKTKAHVAERRLIGLGDMERKIYRKGRKGRSTEGQRHDSPPQGDGGGRKA